MDLKSWATQPTTVAGISALLGTLSGWASGAITMHTAIPLVVTGVVAIIIPDNTGLKDAAGTLAADATTLSEAYLTGLKHGAASAPPPASASVIKPASIVTP